MKIYLVLKDCHKQPASYQPWWHGGSAIRHMADRYWAHIPGPAPTQSKFLMTQWIGVWPLTSKRVTTELLSYIGQ